MKKHILLLILGCIPLMILAQAVMAPMSVSSSSAYTYEGDNTGSGRLQMKVYIMGRVMKPGLYMVPDNTDFLTLLALAGGPAEDAKLSEIRIIRPKEEFIPALNTQSEGEITAEQPITEEEKGISSTSEESRVIKINLKGYIKDGDKKHLVTDPSKYEKGKPIPAEAMLLKPGDTVIVSGTIFYAFSKVADFLSKAAIALSVYNLVTNLGN